MSFRCFTLIFAAIFFFSAQAVGKEIQVYSGEVITSINAINKEGFACGSGVAKAFLLTTLPKFYASIFAEAGLLRGEDNGVYRIALVIDKNSSLQGYKVGPNTDEKSDLVQLILGIERFPALSKNNLCIADKTYLYKFILR